MSYSTLCTMLNLNKSSTELHWTHFVKIDAYESFMSFLNEDSNKILKDEIDGYEKLKNECTPNNNLVLTKDKVIQVCDSDDEVERKSLFLKVCFIYWLQVNAN